MPIQLRPADLSWGPWTWLVAAFLGDGEGWIASGSTPWLVVVLLLVNGLTAFNLTRVFRLVFSGSPSENLPRQSRLANGTDGSV